MKLYIVNTEESVLNDFPNLRNFLTENSTANMNAYNDILNKNNVDEEKRKEIKLNYIISVHLESSQEFVNLYNAGIGVKILYKLSPTLKYTNMIIELYRLKDHFKIEQFSKFRDTCFYIDIQYLYGTHFMLLLKEKLSKYNKQIVFKKISVRAQNSTIFGPTSRMEIPDSSRYITVYFITGQMLSGILAPYKFEKDRTIYKKGDEFISFPDMISLQNTVQSPVLFPYPITLTIKDTVPDALGKRFPDGVIVAEHDNHQNILIHVEVSFLQQHGQEILADLIVDDFQTEKPINVNVDNIRKKSIIKELTIIQNDRAQLYSKIIELGKKTRDMSNELSAIEFGEKEFDIVNKELQEYIKKDKRIHSINFMPNSATLFIKTHALICNGKERFISQNRIPPKIFEYDRFLGKFLIKWELYNKYLSFNNLTLRFEGYNYSELGSHAPHVFTSSKDGHCLGNAWGMLTEGLEKNDFISVINTLLLFLQAPNPFDVAGRHYTRLPIYKDGKILVHPYTEVYKQKKKTIENNQAFQFISWSDHTHFPPIVKSEELLVFQRSTVGIFDLNSGNCTNVNKPHPATPTNREGETSESDEDEDVHEEVLGIDLPEPAIPNPDTDIEEVVEDTNTPNFNETLRFFDPLPRPLLLFTDDARIDPLIPTSMYNDIVQAFVRDFPERFNHSATNPNDHTIPQPEPNPAVSPQLEELRNLLNERRNRTNIDQPTNEEDDRPINIVDVDTYGNLAGNTELVRAPQYNIRRSNFIYSSSFRHQLSMALNPAIPDTISPLIRGPFPDAHIPREESVEAERHSYDEFPEMLITNFTDGITARRFTFYEECSYANFMEICNARNGQSIRCMTEFEPETDPGICHDCPYRSIVNIDVDSWTELPLLGNVIGFHEYVFNSIHPQDPFRVRDQVQILSYMGAIYSANVIPFLIEQIIRKDIDLLFNETESYIDQDLLITLHRLLINNYSSIITEDRLFKSSIVSTTSCIIEIFSKIYYERYRGSATVVENVIDLYYYYLRVLITLDGYLGGRNALYGMLGIESHIMMDNYVSRNIDLLDLVRESDEGGSDSIVNFFEIFREHTVSEEMDIHMGDMYLGVPFELDGFTEDTVSLLSDYRIDIPALEGRLRALQNNTLSINTINSGLELISVTNPVAGITRQIYQQILTSLRQVPLAETINTITQILDEHNIDLYQSTVPLRVVLGLICSEELPEQRPVYNIPPINPEQSEEPIF